MTIRDIAIAFGYEVDKKSEQKVEKSVASLKSMAKSALSAIGVGLSLIKLNAIVEEFTQVNRQLKSAVGEAEDFADVQDRVLNAANNTRTSYSTMSTYVKSLMNSQNSLFSSVDKTLGFAELTTKALKAAGANESTISSLNNGIQSAFVNGKVSAGTFQSLIASCPEAVKYLSQTLGVTERQVRALGTAGAITSNQLYSAFTSNATAIDKAYQNTAMTITEAITHIKNGFGTWLYELNETLQVTQTISKAMVRMFNGVHNGLKKVTGWVEKLNNRIGGAQNSLKLFAIIGGSLYATLNAEKILSFLKIASAILKGGINVKVMLIAGAIALVALLVEDFINFLKGNDSLFGEVFSAMGISAEEMREQLSGIFSKLAQIIGKVAKTILPILVDILGKVIVKVVEIVAKLLPKILGLIEKLLPAVEKIIDAALPILVSLLELINPLLDAVFAILDPLIDILGVLLDLIGPLLDLLTPIVTILLQLLDVALTPLVEIVKMLAKVIGNSLGNNLKLMMVWLQPLVSILGTVWSLFGKIYTVISNLIGKALNPLKDAWKGIYEAIANFFVGGMQKAMDAVKPIADFIGGIADKIKSIGGAIGGLFGGGDEGGSGGGKGIKGFLSGIGNAFKGMGSPTNASGVLNNSTSNRTLTQNVTITNSFSGGSADQQKNGAKAMSKSANDATGIMARGLTYAR